jgi:hypothetical protein
MWAGYLALVNQQAVANGNPTIGFLNPIIYPLALGSGYDTDFHDITSGSNGYPAEVGYDLATGWGSPNGTGLINALAGPPTSNFTISPSPTSVSVAAGSNGTSTITTAVLNGFDAAITLSATGQPTGVTVTFSPTSIAAPGSGASTMTIAAASATTAGTYTISVTGTSGSLQQSANVTLVVTDFSISVTPGSQAVAVGSAAGYTATIGALNGFTGTVTLSASGLPTGATASFTPGSVSGSGSPAVSISTSSSTPAGSSTVTITGTSGSLQHSASVTLVVSSGTAQVSVPGVVGDTQAAAIAAITGAGLVAGTVTTASSTTVPPGDVISESPIAGTSVSLGSAVNLVVSASSVTYTGLDATTQGTWTGIYGTDGYMIANDATSPPAYATVSLTGDSLYTWAASTTSASALQVSSGSSTHIASTYYSVTGFTINVNLTDGNTHQIALYLLDWDSTARSETISIVDAVSNAVLFTGPFSSFHNGEYAVWSVRGHVLIQITKTAGANAVVSGAFFN